MRGTRRFARRVPRSRCARVALAQALTLFAVPAQARDIKGRIYVNEQGINAQLSGYGGDAVAYADWVTSDPRFAGTRVSVYDAPGHSFPRLTLRYKANLVQLEGGTQHLDLSTPEARAHALSPQEWRDKLQQRATGQGPPFLLDVRNGYEWDTGRFEVRVCCMHACLLPLHTAV